MALLRTFVPVEIGPDVISRSQTLMNKLGASDAKVGWIRPAQMHFTLSFLGDIRLFEIPDAEHRDRDRSPVASI